MDYMIAAGLAAVFDVRATRRSSRSEPALGTLPERGLPSPRRGPGLPDVVGYCVGRCLNALL